MILVALDPALRTSGLAIWEGALGASKLVAAFRIENPHPGRGPAAWAAAAMTIYDHFPLKADVFVVEVMKFRGALTIADTLEVQGVAGCVTALYNDSECIGYTPEQWKGQVPKNVHHQRLMKHLTWDEIETIPDDHNARDAVALGLFELKKRGLR